MLLAFSSRFWSRVRDSSGSYSFCQTPLVPKTSCMSVAAKGTYLTRSKQDMTVLVSGNINGELDDNLGIKCLIVDHHMAPEIVYSTVRMATPPPRSH